MTDDPLRYDTWIEDALRSVIRRTLDFAAENGLPGDHHFYITYRTDADGIEIPSYLKAENPEEMTIVLQHQFEDLVINEDALWVTLRFTGGAKGDPCGSAGSPVVINTYAGRRLCSWSIR